MKFSFFRAKTGRKLEKRNFWKVLVLIVTFLQAHWVGISFAAGTVAAASMFGEKSYWTKISENSKKATSGKEAKEAIKILEKNLEEYGKWSAEHPDMLRSAQSQIKDVYIQLAMAKERADYSKEQVIADYVKGLNGPSEGWKGWKWLYKNISLDEYKKILESKIKGNIEDYGLLTAMKSIGDWDQFSLFLDCSFSQAEQPEVYAAKINKYLEKSSVWIEEYANYCYKQPLLIDYVYESENRKAEKYLSEGEADKAIEVCNRLLEVLDSGKRKVETEFKICQLIFESGDYEKAISAIDNFIETNKVVNRQYSKQSKFMKGKSYIQLGEIEKAYEEFLNISLEYPEMEGADECSFFIGYCNMLQGKFEQAKEAFNMVVKDYPQSSYASRAILCLKRIENMTD